MKFPDELQQAWQSQCSKPIDVKPDQLLKVVRLERRIRFWCDVFVILVLLSVGAWMLRSAFRDIHKDWPWLIYSACLAWVVGFMLFNQWRRRRHAPHYEEPLLAHVEWSIKDIEYRMWQDRHTFWWYTLPIALGCMIPPTIFFVMDYIRKREWGLPFASLFTLLFTLGFFAAVFTFVHWAIKRGMRMGQEGRRQELQALRALRESLLNTEEPHI
jgi:hypothetical protein